MSERHVDPAPESNPVSGRAARRQFLKKSGGVAIAAPAAVLLLSATSKSALAQVPPYTFDDAIDGAPTGPIRP